MTAVLISLVASVCWGCADFAGGVYSKRISVLAVLVVVELFGLLAIVAYGVLSAEPVPGVSTLLIAGAAGLSGATGLGLFYRALAVGTMSIVAPVAASGSAIPALYGLATGDPLSFILGLGLGVAMVGIVLASLEAEHEAEEAPRGSSSRVSLALAGAAAVGFGGYFILFDQVADDNVLWSAASARTAPLLVIGLALLATRTRLPVGRDRSVLMGAGLLDAAATVLYGVALTRGALSVVSVVGSLYPVTTVVLARFVLSERVRPIQGVGIVLALTGVALISAG